MISQNDLKTHQNILKNLLELLPQIPQYHSPNSPIYNYIEQTSRHSSVQLFGPNQTYEVDLGVIGKIGSGKSSFLELITRFYDPNRGIIKIDGINIKDFTLGDLRKNIGYVPQNPFLFSESIQENLQFGLKNASVDKIIDASKKAVIHKDIINFKQGYKTILGERGVTLSGGQIQRLSIARVFIKNPKIFLFDDCLSAVDNDTEEEILKNLKSISRNKTTIIVSHRISSLKHANQIIVFENGKIVQQGKHIDLIGAAGYYKELFEKQQADQS